MMAKQISVFLENKAGRLAHLTRVLAENQIDLVALSIADTTDFGILRATVSDTDRAVAVLRDAAFTVNVTQVLALVVPDEPGGLAQVLARLHEGGVSVEYLYSFVRKPGDNALIVFRVAQVETALKVLEAAGIRMLSHEEILAMK